MVSAMRDSAARWTNWQGNQTFVPSSFFIPHSELDVAQIVAGARASGSAVRVSGSGHSNTPIVQTDGVLLDLSQLSGIIRTDVATGTAVIKGGTRISHIGESMWEAGLSLDNQGDTDSQTIGGATATGTKGSGTSLTNMSATVCGLRLVTGTGELAVIDESDRDLLSAAQVSLGLMGVVTEMTIKVAPAYNLQESLTVSTLPEVLELWDDEPDRHRHFSLLWAPSGGSSNLYGLPTLQADESLVKILRPSPVVTGAPQTLPLTGMAGNRDGRAYLVYPDIPDDGVSDLLELEYMVDRRDSRAAFLALRSLMQESFPDEMSPVQVRWQKADEAFLSAQYRRDTVSLSVSSKPDRRTFLPAVDECLRQWDVRPHWGKQHFSTPDQIRQSFPMLDSFLTIRKSFDPEGVFLNDYFKYLFGIET
ncbi:D-arabinono-1,4-lactone oxidase [Rhodococcus sp. NBC_00297]|uniref:D-arabinono-1,4-lactone oxidase n=1 Tax=Rhodococcus sp. NBC_00297 TaxID=2976005 RepID=UPI002E2D2636|nr:D-arabinono-1,4-lactone oxidase [Rhodococcus sp. NBC_00297]